MRARWRPLCVVIAGLWVAGCGRSASGPVAMAVHAGSSLADSPVRIQVRGLRGGQRARLSASWTSVDGAVWTSRTPLRADAHGMVMLSGLDGMRFLWGMRPAHPTGASQRFAPPARGASGVKLSLIANDKTVARATLSRRVTPASVRIRRLTVARDGVYGFLFTPAGRARRTAVIAFGGSEGGDSVIDLAGLLAAHGYPALALAYFKEPGLPSHLLRIPLEYFARAAEILRQRPDVSPAHVVTVGASYGGEASLLVASTFPRLIHGAIALVPSATVTGGLAGRFGGVASDQAAWTLRGKALAQGPIAVEHVNGPVLTQGAGEDGIWDSATAVQQLQRRLIAHHFPFAHQGIIYGAAGHYSGGAVPYLPTGTAQPAYGGSPRADAAARADLWGRILRYLAER